VQRGSNAGVAVAGGLIGALIYSAFGSFQCKQCGAIPRSEFPPEVRQKMMTGSVMLIVGAVGALLLLIVLLVFLASMNVK
jgi:hypothetical protein